MTLPTLRQALLLDGSDLGFTITVVDREGDERTGVLTHIEHWLNLAGESYTVVALDMGGDYDDEFALTPDKDVILVKEPM